jgi:hypothetical protein
MYKLKSMAKRASAFAGAVGLLAGIGTSAVPAFVSADSLNPLTDRSLTLSSSSPGWAYTDGSGNSIYAPPNSGANGQKTGNYFDFKVSTNSDTVGNGGTGDPIKAISFQYCREPAGNCAAPGDDDLATPTGSDDASHADLNVHYTGSATEVSGTVNAGTGTISLTSGSPTVSGSGTNFSSLRVGGTFTTFGGHTYVIKAINSPTSLTITAQGGAAATESGVTFNMSDFKQVIDTTSGLVKAVPGYVNENPKYVASNGTTDAAEAAKNVSGNYIVMYKSGGVWTQSTGWVVAAANQEEAGSGTTGKNNTIVLTHSAGLGLPSGTEMKVLFFARTNDYITNPGSGYFFVKINTFKSFTTLVNPTDLATQAASNNVIDGGVTVANVMNQSIQITTKVLETMEFSVGTVDPDTLDATQLAASDTTGGAHAPCNTILTRMTSGASVPKNVLQLGDQNSESSLKTGQAYATHSYWRLSSNSSAGATVYYSGHTLSNTSGDEIAPIGTTSKISAPGSEQFGLALDTATYAGGHGFDDATYGVNYQTAGSAENGADNLAAGILAANAGTPKDGTDDSVLTDLNAVNTPPWDYTNLNKSFHLPRLDPLVPNTNYSKGAGPILGNGSDPTEAKFAFDPMSDTVPAPIATEGNQVVDCVTGKMRYIANIAATTPAGIYTTKVNYIAAPQY